MNLNLKLVEDMARNGYNDKDIANNLGITEEKFLAMKQKNKKLHSIINNQRNLRINDNIENVENALIKLCMGYNYIEKVYKYKDDEKYCYQELEKFVPPNFAAIKFYLCNRKSEAWADDTSNIKQMQLCYDDNFVEALEKSVKNIWGKNATTES